MTPEAIAQFIAQSKWIFAKSMPQVPHEYALRKQSDERLFVEFVLHIRAAGEVRPWGKYRHTYLDVGPHSYWTMGAPIGETILINREIKGINDHIGRRNAPKTQR